MPAHRRALIATVVSLVVTTAFYLWRVPDHPLGDLSGGMFTDHPSHVSAARIFPSIGLDIWRVPLDQLYPAISLHEQLATVDARLNLHLAYRVPGWEKPLFLSWAAYPRMYPPGDMVVVAPVAIAYQFTDLSFAAASRLTILLYLALAHVTLYLMFRAAIESPPGSAPARPLALLVAYGLVVYWTLEGFYDGLAIAPLVASAWFLRRRRGLAALVAYCVGAALHFRAFFLAPWALYAAWLVLEQRAWRSRRAWVALGAVVVLSLASLVPFALVWSSTGGLPQHTGLTELDRYAAFAAVGLLCGLALWRARAWLDLAVLGWLGVMLATFHALYAWYVVAMLPWLLSPVVLGRVHREHLVADARFVAIAGWTLLTAGAPLVPGWPLLQWLAG